MSLHRRTGVAVRSLLAAGALVAALLPGAATVAASDADDAGLRAAETYLFGLLNGERTAHDLVPYRLDTRLVAIAQARAADMAANDYLSHTQPDGRDVFDYIRDQGIAWYGAGEIIAWNSWGDPLDSATVANQMWMGSSGHRAIILATGYNYVGMGVARAADGRYYWAVVTLKGPDRTGARASMRAPYKTGGTPVNGRVPVKLRWSGSDVRLQVLTAGLKNYLVQFRLDGGDWKTLWTGTTATSAIRYLTPGHVYDFRVRARDNAGNLGAFTLPVTIRP